MRPGSHVDVTLLQSEIEQRAQQAGPDPPFYQLHLQRVMPVLAEAVKVDPNPPILGRTLYERIWAVINRGIRRVARYGVEPAVLMQNDANARVQRSLEHLIAGDAALHAEVVRLRAEGKRGQS